MNRFRWVMVGLGLVLALYAGVVAYMYHPLGWEVLVACGGAFGAWLFWADPLGAFDDDT